MTTGEAAALAWTELHTGAPQVSASSGDMAVRAAEGHRGASGARCEWPRGALEADDACQQPRRLGGGVVSPRKRGNKHVANPFYGKRAVVRTAAFVNHTLGGVEGSPASPLWLSRQCCEWTGEHEGVLAAWPRRHQPRQDAPKTGLAGLSTTLNASPSIAQHRLTALRPTAHSHTRPRHGRTVCASRKLPVTSCPSRRRNPHSAGLLAFRGRRLACASRPPSPTMAVASGPSHLALECCALQLQLRETCERRPLFVARPWINSSGPRSRPAAARTWVMSSLGRPHPLPVSPENGALSFVNLRPHRLPLHRPLSPQQFAHPAELSATLGHAALLEQPASTTYAVSSSGQCHAKAQSGHSSVPA